MAEAGARPSPGADLAPGSYLGARYRIRRFLGRGGMGAVYAADDEALGETVALKLLTLTTPRALERFRQEVRLARRVTHPNVARTYDLGHVDGFHFLTMEFVEGGTLDELLSDRGALPLEDAFPILLGVAAGLGAAHRADVVHRDLKPENVMVERTGRVVLTDFGIARCSQESPPRAKGQLVGTPHYMAPEQIASGTSDARSDVFALGVMLFELLTGELPWDGDTALAIALARLETPAPDPRIHRPLPADVADLINECLDVDPEQRPADGDALRARLEALEFAGGVKPPSWPSAAALYAPLTLATRALAILPFAYRGDPALEYLGAGIAEELIDTFSQTRDVRVLAIGATQHLGARSDPSALRELGAQEMVTGTVRCGGGRVRIAARLIDTATGEQRWTGSFEGSLADVFELEESLGRRIAEALRIELDAAWFRGTAPVEAIEAYLRARSLLRQDLMAGATDACALLDRCVELAPDFRPGLAAHAIASIHRWWSNDLDPRGDRGAIARASAKRALEKAPGLAETHLVAAMLANQDGEFRTAAQALGQAIDIAPTLPEAHMRLGAIQAEAGRVGEARRRLLFSLELDPTLSMAQLTLARMAILEGDLDEAHQRLDAIDEHLGRGTVPVVVLRVRDALYRRDEAGIRRGLEALSKLPGQRVQKLAGLYTVALGDCSEQRLAGIISTLERVDHNQRFRTMLRQHFVEALSVGGHVDEAMGVLAEAAAGPLIDIEWFDRCTALDPLRERAGFSALRERVSERAASIWT